MKTYRLRKTQQLSCDIETAWAFFSIPANLARITPPEMKFTEDSDAANQPVYEGMVLDFHVSPLFGIRMKWQSQITQVNPGRSFTDMQTKGPYRLWRHHHEYIPNNDGVLVVDTVDYQLPYGLLGRLAHGIVRRKLEHLFEYRHRVLAKYFNQNVSG